MPSRCHDAGIPLIFDAYLFDWKLDKKEGFPHPQTAGPVISLLRDSSAYRSEAPIIIISGRLQAGDRMPNGEIWDAREKDYEMVRPGNPEQLIGTLTAILSHHLAKE